MTADEVGEAGMDRPAGTIDRLRPQLDKSRAADGRALVEMTTDKVDIDRHASTIDRPRHKLDTSTAAAGGRSR
jgi:hypothetical protein